MRRTVMVAVLTAAFMLPATAAFADHVPPNIGAPTGLPADNPSKQVGDWRFLANLPAGPGAVLPLGVDWEPFSRGDKSYVAFSSMTMGITIVDVTDPLHPVRVSDYASAFGCPTGAAEALAGGAEEPGNVVGWENDLSITPDGMIGILGTDEITTPSGRCHDPAGGGLELVDMSDVANPRTLHLTRNAGQAHSVTVDPKRPWLAYLSTSDSSDLIEVVDFRSCLGGVAQIDRCKPHVARAVLDERRLPGLPHDVSQPGQGLVGRTTGAPPPPPQNDALTSGCHDIRFRGDRIYCAALGASVIIDISGVLDANGNLRGTDLTAAGSGSCTTIDANAVRAAGVKVTDCSGWTEEEFDKRGAQAIPMRFVGLVKHDGSKPPDQDIEIAHQAEAIDGGKIMFITDERGGGLNAGPDECPAGGVWFYDIRDEGRPRLMRQPDGKPAVFITQNFVQTNANCTVHYGTEFDNEHVLVFAWYTQGTHVIKYTPDYSTTPATIRFEEVGTYIPALASTWTSKGLIRNPEDPDEIVIYTTDISRGMDVLTFKYPAPLVAAAAKPRVLSETKGRNLPRSGTGEPVTAGLALLAVAALVIRALNRASLRRVQI